MRNVMRALALLLAFATTTLAAGSHPTREVIAQSIGNGVNVPGGTVYSQANPLLPLSGGVGPVVFPTATGSDFFEGDSITYGYLASSCSRTSATPSGTCFSDLVSIADGVAEVNTGVTGTCLEYTTTSGSPCNASSATTGSVIQRYANDFTQLSAGMRFHLMIGTNDLGAYDGGWGTGPINGETDPQITPSAFKTDLVTVLSAAAAIVGAQNVEVSKIPYNPHVFQPLWNTFNFIIADVAAQYGYSVAETDSSLAVCAIQYYGTDTCINTDYIHPDNDGYAQVALDVEAANYSNAIADRAAMRGTLDDTYFANFANYLANNYRCGFQAMQEGTGKYNTVCGSLAGNDLTTGQDETLYGNKAASLLTSGSYNTFYGASAGNAMTTAFDNLGYGFGACESLSTGSNNICIGDDANTTGTTVTKDIFIGTSTVPGNTTGTQELVIGYGATGLGSNSITIQPGGAPGFYSGTGVPTFSAPNASIYLNYAGTTGSRWYANTSGASTSGNTWTAQVTP